MRRKSLCVGVGDSGLEQGWCSGGCGALAERTVVPKTAYTPIAEGIGPAIATVLGTAITGMSIRSR
jgi:hypothetical protein